MPSLLSAKELERRYQATTNSREREALETALLLAEALDVCHRECNMLDCPFGDSEGEDCRARDWLRGDN